MEDKKYRTYTQAFKLEAIELLKRSGKKAGQLEQELGITPGLLLKWRACYQARPQSDGKVSLEPSNLEAAKAEIHQLQHRLALVEEERDILKKVVTIFSRSTP